MTKIERSGNKLLAITLLQRGLTEIEIARSLTDHCRDNDIRDSSGNLYTISQATVNRELKEYRAKYKSKAQNALTKHIDDHIVSDLKAIEEAEKYHLGIARIDGSDHRVRSDAYMKMSKLIFEKLRTALGGSDEDDISGLIAEEVRKSLNPELKEQVDALIPKKADNKEVRITH